MTTPKNNSPIAERGITCDKCGKTYIHAPNPNGCLVNHQPGGCCHYGQKEPPPPQLAITAAPTTNQEKED